MLTYLIVNDDGSIEFSDGFSCGTMKSITKKHLDHYFGDGWYNHKNQWIGGKSKAAKFVREQWYDLLDESNSNGLKAGVRIGWFEENLSEVDYLMIAFLDELRKLRCKIDGRAVASLCSNIRRNKVWK